MYQSRYSSKDNSESLQRESVGYIPRDNSVLLQRENVGYIPRDNSVLSQRENVGFIPFYMAYPLPLFYEEESALVRDLEYFDSLYPKETRMCQTFVAEKLHMLDYEGSAIFDEFPDRIHLESLVDMIYREIIKTKKDESMPKELVRMVTYMEIYKKRHKKTNGILRF